MDQLIWENGKPMLIIGDNEEEDDWLKVIDPEGHAEDIQIHKDLARKHSKKED